MKKQCEPMSPSDEILFREEFVKKKNRFQGKDLIRFLNTRVRLRKKRVIGGRTIFFPLKAVENQEDDKLMRSFLMQIKAIYHAVDKTPANWIYLANAVMAFNQYHDKWNQIGTNPESYTNWVNVDALLSGLSRLTKILKSGIQKDQSEKNKNFQSCFERELVYTFPSNQYIEGNGSRVLGVQGICDWTGEGLFSPKGEKVDILEIKFVTELGNIHRLQILVYCALLSIQLDRSCSGMLYNARTCELEICSIKLEKARDFLQSISQFKNDGTKWQCPQPALEKDKDTYIEVGNQVELSQISECSTTSLPCSTFNTKRKREDDGNFV